MNCTYLKYELNRSYNGGGVVYVLKSELSRSTGQYILERVDCNLTKTLYAYPRVSFLAP